MGVIVQLSSRGSISAIVLISFALTLIEVPRGDWASLAAMSLASGVAALADAASALLGGRLRAVESLFGGRVYPRCICALSTSNSDDANLTCNGQGWASEFQVGWSERLRRLQRLSTSHSWHRPGIKAA